MSAKALHALVTLVLGVAVAVVWLRTFWNEAQNTRATILAAPLAVAVLGLGHWINYDFSMKHWAADFSLIQAALNVLVSLVLLQRHSSGRSKAVARLP